jgi:hypothetical protein
MKIITQFGGRFAGASRSARVFFLKYRLLNTYLPRNYCSRNSLLHHRILLHHNGRVGTSFQVPTPRLTDLSHSLTPAEQRELNTRMEAKQLKEFMKVNNPMTRQRGKRFIE